MTKTNSHLPSSLSRLDPSSQLERLPLSRLARSGTRKLRELVESGRPVAVTVQGQGTMVALSQRQYDEMVDLIRQQQAEDALTRALAERFDVLTTQMNRPGNREATETALFAEPEALNASYRPGETGEKA